jgi:hypothetical protein
MSSPDNGASAPPDRAAIRAACALIGSLRDSNALELREIQTLLAAAVRLYSDHAAKSDAGPVAFAADAVTATDAMVASTAILKAVNLQLFELGMWQAWTGR